MVNWEDYTTIDRKKRVETVIKLGLAVATDINIACLASGDSYLKKSFATIIGKGKTTQDKMVIKKTNATE